MMKQYDISTLVLIALLVIACSGTALKLGTSWNPNEEKFFDNGIDILDTTSNAFSQWGFQQKTTLEGRVQLSDYIAVVKIRSIKTTNNTDGGEAKHIGVTISDELYGSHPEKQLSLKSNQSFPGYVLVQRYEKRLKGEFILFSRWFSETVNGPDPQGLGYRFHLSLASPAMLEAVKKKITTRMTLEAKGRP